MLANRHQLRTGTGSNAAALQTESKATSEGSSKEKHASELERALSAAEGEVVRLAVQLEKERKALKQTETKLNRANDGQVGANSTQLAHIWHLTGTQLTRNYLQREAVQQMGVQRDKADKASADKAAAVRDKKTAELLKVELDARVGKLEALKKELDDELKSTHKTARADGFELKRLKQALRATMAELGAYKVSLLYRVSLQPPC